MKVKDLIQKLRGYHSNSTIQFYFLDNYNLESCEIETIIKPYDSQQVEITIKPYNTDEGGNKIEKEKEISNVHAIK